MTHFAKIFTHFSKSSFVEDCMRSGMQRPMRSVFALAAYICALAVMLGNFGCSSSSQRQDEAPASEKVLPSAISDSDDDYQNILDRWTLSDKVYQGLQNRFQVTASVLSPELLMAQLKNQTRTYQWSAEEFTKKRDEVLKEAQVYTKVFLSFFTPVDEDNNLDKTKSIWNLVLVADGKRYSPTSVKRAFSPLSELKQKYPFHNPWSRPYEVTFPVSASVAIQKRLVLVISGPVGNCEMPFIK